MHRVRRLCRDLSDAGPGRHWGGRPESSRRDAILLEAAGMMQSNGVDLEEARDVILRDLLGEQPLPLAARG
jgi:hypothetical protein